MKIESMRRLNVVITLCFLFFTASISFANSRPGNRVSFNQNWRFNLGDVSNAQDAGFDDSQWRQLNLPHDWSIEGEFSEKAPSGTGGGALPGGLGWYRKTFTIPATAKGKLIFIEFDGVYRNSEVWLNGHYLGKRPYGYSTFEYELTPHLFYGAKPNVIAVKVDNSKQPNSRWYSGSGIYRNVWLTIVNKIHVGQWGVFITTPHIKKENARIQINYSIANLSGDAASLKMIHTVYDASNKQIVRISQPGDMLVSEP